MHATKWYFAEMGILGWLLTALVVSSTIETVRFETVVGNFQISHLLTVALLAATPFTDPTLRRVEWTTVVFLAVFGLLALPTTVSFQEAPRSLPVLQLGMNLLTFIVSIGLALRLGNRLRLTVTTLTVLLSLFSLIQIVVAPTLSRGEEPRLLGIPRPTLWLEEPTWLALIFALLCATAFQLRLRWVGTALLAIVIVIWTRAAAAIAVPATLIQSRIMNRFHVLIVALLVMIPFAGIAAVMWVVWAPNLPIAPSASSIVTRIWDAWAVTQANGGQFWPWGGVALDVYDADRSRHIPYTSNVLPFELLWKYGFAGIGMYFVVCAFFLLLPAVASGTLRWRGVLTPAGIAFALLPLAFTFNNALGRPSMWVSGGLVIAALIHSSSGERSNRSEREHQTGTQGKNET